MEHPTVYDHTRHNYVRKVEEFARTHDIEPGRLHEIGIYHDDWCDLHRGGYCNCDPEVKLLTVTRPHRPDPAKAKAKARAKAGGKRKGKAPVPPIPPDVDRLRAARKAVDPATTYRLETPDGSVAEVTGRELIEAADAMVALADAQRAGDKPGIRRAVERIIGEPPSRESRPDRVALCLRVGSAPFVPPGYMTADCGECGHAVWIAPDTLESCRQLGAVPLCQVCSGWPAPEVTP